MTSQGGYYSKGGYITATNNTQFLQQYMELIIGKQDQDYAHSRE